jgi:oxygen-independent coproporphyrinogen-3 oxidase
MDHLGVYVQVPFCQTKCTYCNFHTGVVSADRYAPYAAAVGREIREHEALWGAAGVHLPNSIHNSLVNTVYVGGGTPSLLEPPLLAGILTDLRAHFRHEWSEVTLEADPETVEPEKAAAWRDMGINRISFGAQSFVDEELKAAGRMHRRSDIYRATDILRAAGLRNLSFDLIAGLPKQTPESWRASISEAIALRPEHISIYMMEIDEGSRLGLEVLQSGPRYSARDLPTDEEMADFYEEAQRELKRAGYAQYEISNWALPGRESQHNLKYWRREAYLGFGAGAHSYAGTQRWANAHDALRYVQLLEFGRAAVENVEEVTRSAALEEELFLGLRQLAGIHLARIESEYGVELRGKVDALARSGMLEREGDLVKLAPGKLSLSNEVIVELLRNDA